MTILADRSVGCLSPVPIAPVVDAPEGIRDLARRSGPFFMPARYLIDAEAADAAGGGTTKRTGEIPSYLIGPVWRGDWARNGEVLEPESASLLFHPPFVEAAKKMCEAEVVVPQQVFVNLTTPMGGNPFSHTDIPEFVGIDRSNAPGWFLAAMGASGLFEDIRITVATAVAWFHHGERGYFRYWPRGRDAPSVRHENMWNTAVLGDNDFMHHQVERVGPRDLGPPDGLTIDTTLDHDGESWVVVDDGTTLATYDEDHVRLSLSWKAHVYADEATRTCAAAGDGAVTVAEALSRFQTAMEEPLAATGNNALASTELRDQFTTRWTSYRSD